LIKILFSISADAWVQTIGTILGSFIGAFLAGLYAVKIMKSQIKIQQTDKRKDELVQFIKTVNSFDKILSGFIGSVTGMVVISKSTSHPHFQTNFEREKASFNRYKNELDLINSDRFIEESHLLFIEVKALIEEISSEADIYSNKKYPSHMLERTLDRISSLTKMIQEKQRTILKI
jgi:hypothetical protein